MVQCGGADGLAPAPGHQARYGARDSGRNELITRLFDQQTVIARAWHARRRHALTMLGGAAVLSGAIYAAYLTVAFLPTYVGQRQIYLFDRLGYGLGSRLISLLALVVLFAAAIIAWRVVALAPPSNALWLGAIAPPVVFGVLLVFTQPLLSRDLFHYIMEGRILGVHATNPYAQPPAAFPDDPLFPYTNWVNYPSPYGPVWVALATAVTLLAGDSLLVSVLLFKGVAFGAYLACGALIGLLLRRLEQPVLPGVVLWLWNPLVLIEFAGNGHNDVLMLAGLLLGLVLLAWERPRLALLAVTVAALVKYVALPILPLLLWHRLWPLASWRARLREAVRFLWAPAALTVALLGPFWIGFGTLGFLRESDHYYSSVPYLARLGLELVVDPTLAGRIVRGTIALGLVVGYLALLRQIDSAVPVLLLTIYRTFFLLVCLWSFFVPWYSAWPVALAATLGTARAGRQVLLLSALALLSYEFQFYSPGQGQGSRSVEFRSSLSALVVFVPVLLSFVPWARLRQHWRLRGGRAVAVYEAELPVPAERSPHS